MGSSIKHLQNTIKNFKTNQIKTKLENNYSYNNLQYFQTTFEFGAEKTLPRNLTHKTLIKH